MTIYFIEAVKFLIKNRSLDNVGDFILSATSLVQFFLNTLQILLLDSGLMSENGAGTVRILCSVFFVLFSFIWILKRNPLLFIGSYTIILLLFYASISLNSNNFEYIITDGFRLTLCTSIPIFLSFVSIKDKQIFFRIALYLSVVVVLIGIIYVVMQYTGSLIFKESTYNMGLGYSLLFPTLYLINYKKTIYLIIGIVSIFIILLAGSRGPLVPIVAFIVLRKFLIGTLRDKMVWTLFLVMGIFVFFLLLEELPAIVVQLQSFGINSRTLMYLSEGIVTNDSGRGEIYSNVISKIVESPIIGYGVFADRNFVNGVYCHNIFLELFVDFGCFIPILGMVIFITYLSRILCLVSRQEMLFFMLLFLVTIIPLLVSGSYLTDFRFPLFLGYVYVVARKYFPIRIIRVKNG